MTAEMSLQSQNPRSRQEPRIFVTAGMCLQSQNPRPRAEPESADFLFHVSFNY